MENIVIIAVIALIVGGAVAYIYRSKKRGDVCVGCPYAKGCGGCCSGEKDVNITNESDLG